MAEHTSDFIAGEMDVSQQASTFHHFIKFTKWGSLLIATAVLMATISFCTTAGFLAAIAAGVVVFACGVLLLREKPHAPSH
jgi:hypothetical protein